MEELFRFSVVRAASRANAPTISLKHPGQGTAGGVDALDAFQQQLRTIILDGVTENATSKTIWQNLEPVALDYVLKQASTIMTYVLWKMLHDVLDYLRQALYVDEDLSKLSSDALSKQFGPVTKVETFPEYRYALSDLFLALMILRRGGPSRLDSIIRDGKLWQYTALLSNDPSLGELADLIRIAALIQAGPAVLAPPPEAKTPAEKLAAIKAAFEKAMALTLLFPPAVFSPLKKPINGVGFRELHVVNQHIRRYELKEIGRIENILKGETRAHSQKHTLSNEKDITVQTETTTETDKELSSNDHVDIKNESQNQVKEDTRVDAGVHAQYDGGSFHLQADLTVSYDKSTEDSKTFASDVAKDVTQKSVNKVTERVLQTQTTKIIETFEDTESQSFDNKDGKSNISGIYQWVEKVYLSQVFNLGRHMLIDLMVPEPGAALLAAAQIPPADQEPPVPPDPLGTVKLDASGNPVVDGDGRKLLDKPLLPSQLSEDSTDPNYYGAWVAKFLVTGVEPPPPKFVSVAKSIASTRSDDIGQIVANDVMDVADGYVAHRTNVAVTWLHDVPTTGGGSAMLDVIVGGQTFHFDKDNHVFGNWGETYAGKLSFDYPDPPDPTVSEQGQLPVTIAAVWVEHAAVDIELICQRTDERAFAKWQLATYEKIVAAWQKLDEDFASKLADFKAQGTQIGPLGAADPDANRLTERTELKRHCVAILDNANETVDGVTNVAVESSPDPSPKDPNSIYKPVLPEPNLAVAQGIGATVRWFEQAFEWENVAYVSYPYFWGRRTTWLERLNLKNDDPLFLKFLQAGYARVLVPVRLGFEWAMQFYLNTGLPWLGGDLPPVGDDTQNPLYLDIAEEIKALTGGGEPGEPQTPVGDPWEYNLPTTLIKLRPDDTLPEWHRVNPQGVEDEKNYPSNQPDGTWSWRDGAPK